MIAIRAVVKNGVIKPLETIDLPEDKEIVIYITDEKAEEERFFFPSAFDFWNDAREDLYQQHIVINDLCDERKKFPL